MYRFIKSAIGKAITGTSDQGLVRPRPPAIDSIYGSAYNVRGQLFSTRPGHMLTNNRVVIVGVTGNGSFINKSPQLTPLAKKES